MNSCFGSAAATLRRPFAAGLVTLLTLLSGCGPAARATPARAVDSSALFVGLVHWSPSEVMAHGLLPAFPRDEWVAVVGSDGYVRHGRIGGASRHECDHCVGPRMAIVLSIREPSSNLYAIGPSQRRLSRVALIHEISLEGESPSDAWAPTASFDLDEDGTPDLERVERCSAMVPTGCDGRACTRRCAASRTVGETAVRGELCTSVPAYPQPCLPPAPEPPPEVIAEATIAAAPETTPAEAAHDENVPDETVPYENAPDETASGETTPDETVSDPDGEGDAPRRRWGSRRRPR